MCMFHGVGEDTHIFITFIVSIVTIFDNLRCFLRECEKQIECVWCLLLVKMVVFI